MSEITCGDSRIIFGGAEPPIKRIVNLPAGATAEIHESHEDFLAATVTLHCGTTERWVLAHEKDGDYRLYMLNHRIYTRQGVVLYELTRLLVKPLAALVWCLSPVIRAYNFLANDWQEYRKQLDENHRQ